MTLVYLHWIMFQSSETQSQEKEGKSVATLQQEMLGDLETIDIGSPKPTPSGKKSVVGESLSADDKGDQLVEIDLGGFEERQIKNKSMLKQPKSKKRTNKKQKKRQPRNRSRKKSPRKRSSKKSESKNSK